MILVLGATGYLGNATARRLLASGESVRAMTRTLEKGEELQALGAEVVQGDLRDEASLRSACSGVDSVFTAAHSLLGRGQEASKYVDDRGQKRLIDVAKAAKVHHFVFTSVQGAAVDNPVPFNRIKADVEQYLKQSGLSYTILRPSAFMEWHAHIFIGKPILEKGKVTLFGPGENLINLVAADDVARFAIIGLTDPKALGKTIEVGGPEDWTRMDIARLYERVAGREAKISHIPLSALRVMSPLMKPFHPGLSQVMRFSILTETADFTIDPSATLKQYPMELTLLEDWVQDRVAGFASPEAAPA
jgi:NADH dehydrogenase